MKKRTLLTLAMAVLFAFSVSVHADIPVPTGTNPATNAPWWPGDTYRLVFVSSTLIDATSSDISVYNAHVQSAANAAGYGSVTWKAIVSTATIDARDNTVTNPLFDGDGEPVYLINGTDVIATGYEDLWDGSISHAINLNENLGGLNYSLPIWTQYSPVWTGTAIDGMASNPLGEATVSPSSAV